MAFYYNPVTGKVQKVTAAQKEAVENYKRHENIKAMLDNENVPIVIAGGFVSFVLMPVLIAVLLKLLKDEGASITEELTSKVVKLSPAYWLFKVSEFGTEKGLDIGTDINKFFTDISGGGKFEELFKP